ncbi:MAG: Ig-like domain-containing protein [Prevotella sp.]|nr:Ig-like domain-containing protein [Prevotella sp.]
MNKQLRLFVGLFLAMLGMTLSVVAADFQDFSVIVNNKAGSLLTSDEQVQGTAVSFGVAVVDGVTTRVAVDDASAIATVSGTYHSDHGCTGLSVVVPVPGSVKITVGQCTYSGNTITVKNSNGETVVSKTPSSPACWKNNTSNVDELYYTGEATTLTISGMGYCPYVAVEAVNEAPSVYMVSFGLGSETAEGTVPASSEVQAGDAFTIPANKTLYKEGYTLTGWTDGSTTYDVGASVTLAGDLTLTPVFTANTKSLADRTEAVTLTWPFHPNQGAPTLNAQGSNGTGIYVVQATVEGETIDVKLDYDATSGKLSNAGRTTWTQINTGTKLTVPSCKDAVVSAEFYSSTSATTIDGQTDYTPGTSISYTVASTSETIDIVMGDNNYIGNLAVTLPVVENNVNAFVDIKANIQQPGLSDNPTTFGVFVDSEGTVTFSETTEGANMVINASSYNGSQHGWVNVVATVAVDGPVKVTVGGCNYNNSNTVTIQNTEGEVTSFTIDAGCWDKNAPDANVSSGNYMGGASTLTITCGTYTPYIAVEAIDASSASVSFSLGDVVCEGTTLPEGGTFAVGDAFTIPANKTLYKEGYTLTGWTDGSNTYDVGASVTLEGDLTLTPVFTANTKSLADRTEAVALTWPFHPNQGAPTLNAQGGNGIGVYVTQATVAGETIDVKLDYDATNGKLYNVERSTWTQINTGTKLTVPSCKDAVVSAEFYSSTSATTIDGQTDYTAGTSISYTVASSAETIDIVMGDNNYIGNLAVTLPVVESSGGDSFDNVAGTINWPVGNEETPTIASDIAGAVASATVSVGSDLTATVAQYFNKNMMKYQPTNSNAGNVEEVMIEYRVKMAAGVKFTPVSVSFDAVKVGTNNATFSYSYTTDDIESTITDMNASTVLRNDNSNASSAELNHSLDVSAASECDVFSFRFYISKTANNKQIALGNIVITGTVNGEVQEVTTYVLDVVASPAEGGSVSLYPADGEYEEGAEVKATATENFGYDFVNWTNSAGEVVSEEAQFTYTMPANAETLTANFVAVETYELALTVEGTNDYMVTLSPAPTVVDGKNMYEAGSVVTVTANQYEGLVTFTNWSNGQTAAAIDVTMNDDVTLTANYEQADIIAGWDFYKKGNSGRLADFASEDNATAAFTLTNGTSATSWLDKSTEAANGYESLKGAAVNWKTPVGEYYWQTTKMNAEQFKDINLQFQMLYNYNSYTTFNVEYSLDGESWTKFGSITMEGAKNVASFNETLPEACNNQASLYIRWIPDYDSNVAGASGNDGNAIAMVFFTGTQQMADDDVPPVLVSTIPEDDATGASATGKVVLTFDEKVQVAEGTTATLGDITLEPSVLGKTVTFSYKGLDYATAYTFTLEANSVSDLSGNVYAEPITLSFTTMERPAVNKGLYDWVVPTDGTFEDAIAAANGRTDKTTRYRIFLMDGTYTLPKSATATIRSDDGNDYPSPITYLNASNVSIIGESTDGVVITNDLADAATFAGQFGTVSVYDGISKSDVLQIGSGVTGTYFQNVTIKSGIDDALGRNIAVQDRGSKTIYKDVCLWGYQDTWTSNNNNGLYYFENGKVRGRTDFFCGKGDAYFNEVDIQVCMNTGGYISVPSTPAAKGWVFANCTIKGESSSLNGAYTLGRPWGSGTPIALWINTTMEVIPSAAGWSEMSNGWPARFAEYNSMTSSGSAVDLSGRKTVFGDGHENNPVLTEEEANAALDMSAMFGEWEPMLYTEQAPVPENVLLAGTTLTWNDSDYALLWAICKDGKVVDFTDEPTFEVDDASATWSVRAANEMGGLSEATEAVIETVTVTISSSTYATFYYEEKGFAIPEGVNAYTATKSGSVVILHPVEGVIPVGVPVVLHAEAGEYVFTRNDVSPMVSLENDLIGSEEGGKYDEEGYKYYVLCWKNKEKKVEEVGFYYQSGSQGAYAQVNAHQAFLRVENTSASADGYPFVFDEATGITSAENEMPGAKYDYYTVDGRKLNGKPTVKGIYIVNGRKVVVK